MGARFKDLPVGTCYRKARARRLRKKAALGAYVTVTKRGLRRGREQAGARVKPASCPLNLLGVGLRTPRQGTLTLGNPKQRKKCQ